MSKAMEVYADNVGNTHSAAIEAVFAAGVTEGRASVTNPGLTIEVPVTNDFVSVPGEPVEPITEPVTEPVA
jgi:hypothetical protein